MDVSVTNPTNFTPPTINTGIPISKWEIKGECLKVQKTISLQKWQSVPPDLIKRDIAFLFVEEMIKNNMIEFTSQIEPHATDVVEIRARIFVTPDEQVRILRVNGVI